MPRKGTVYQYLSPFSWTVDDQCRLARCGHTANGSSSLALRNRRGRAGRNHGTADKVRFDEGLRCF